jgi:hypothetical protein
MTRTLDFEKIRFAVGTEDGPRSSWWFLRMMDSGEGVGEGRPRFAVPSIDAYGRAGAAVESCRWLTGERPQHGNTGRAFGSRLISAELAWRSRRSKVPKNPETDNVRVSWGDYFTQLGRPRRC